MPRLIAALVAVLGIAAAGNALLLAVRRRGSEIAVLRALGLRPSDARRVLGWQAATMATVAALVGIPVGILLGRIVWTGIARPANVVIRVDVDPIQLVAIPSSFWPCSSPSPSGRAVGRRACARPKC